MSGVLGEALVAWASSTVHWVIYSRARTNYAITRLIDCKNLIYQVPSLQ